MEYNKVCEYCGKSFQATRSDARFCSATHRTMSNKATRKAERKDQATSDPDPVYSQATNEAGLLSEVLRRLIDLDQRLKTEEVYLSPVQACELLSISRTTFDRYVRDGLLKTFYLRGKESKTKKKIYVRKSDVLDLFQENK